MLNKPTCLPPQASVKIRLARRIDRRAIDVEEVIDDAIPACIDPDSCRCPS
jgi:hypothetical protein